MEWDIHGRQKNMNKMNVFYILTFVFIILAVVFVIYNRQKEKATLQKMIDMLESAITGTFSEISYDETKLSALESKLNRFLLLSKSSELSIAEEKDKIKSLVSDISHQTKTPLANIILYTQLLQEQKELSDGSRSLVGEVTAQSEKLSFLIQALVKTSRLETGIINVNSHISSVIDLLKSSINAIQKNADEKNITLILLCDNNINACFDPKWTEEAIVNIIDNSVKYTPAGGVISVSVRAYELFTSIEIADNGIGIEEQEINHIFKRFYRCASVHQYEGVGIGLYLTREILSAEGGYIKVKSELARGTAFSVFLPNSEK